MGKGTRSLVEFLKTNSNFDSFDMAKNKELSSVVGDIL